MFFSLLLTSKMASAVTAKFEFDFPRLTGFHGFSPGFEDEGLEAYKEAIREDMMTTAQKPQAALAFVRSVLAGKVLVRDMANARIAMITGAEEASEHLRGLNVDYQPWYDLIQEVI
jgi:hypothetical protein